MANIIVLPEDKVKQLFKDAIIEIEKEKASEDDSALLTINQVAKKLKMAHTTVKKLVENDLIKATKNNRISNQALNDYLQGE